MGVNIGYHRKTQLSAELPQRSKSDGAENNDARVQAIRIEIVVVDEACDPASFIGILSVGT